MKRKLFILSLILISCSHLRAQRQIRIGYVNMDYILENMPTYQTANAALNQKVQQWRETVELKQQKIKALEEALENERPLLTQDLIEERQSEIDYLRKKLQRYQQKRFGPQGDMMRQQQQILRPIRDAVFNAIQQIGLKREYDFIFDSTADALLLFSAKRHDISDQVLAMITRQSKIEQRRQRETPRKQRYKDDETLYKSVRQARQDRQERAQRQMERQRQEAKQEALIEQRQQKRDSIRSARKAERLNMLKQRQARRDSLKKARQEILLKRQKKRDSHNASTRNYERKLKKNQNNLYFCNLT